MDFYPDILVIAGTNYKAQHSTVTGAVLLPYKDEPDVKVGDVITKKTDDKEVSLKVLEASFRRIGTFSSATKNPHMLTMKVEVSAEAPHKAPEVAEVAPRFDESEHPTTVALTLQQLIEKISVGNDGEAKDIVRKLLQNRTVTGLLGAGADMLYRKLT